MRNPGGPTVSPFEGAGGCSLPIIDGDGSIVVYISIAPNLVVGQTSTNTTSLSFNLFRYNRLTGTTVVVSGARGSPTVTGDNQSTISAISADGNEVAFVSSDSNLVPGQVGPIDNIFLYNAGLAAQGLPAVSLVSHLNGFPLIAVGGATPYRPFGNPISARLEPLLSLTPTSRTNS